MIRQGLGFALVLGLSVICSQAYAAHYQYVSLADIDELTIKQGDTWSWTVDLVNDNMYLWELNSPPSSTPGSPTPDISTAESTGSYDPLSPLHYTYLRIDPNNTSGESTSDFIQLTINGNVVEDWSNPISIYKWDPVQDPYGIAGQNYSFTVELTGLSTLGGGSLDITNVNIEGCFDKAPATVPVPAAIWLLGSALLGYLGIARRKW